MYYTLMETAPSVEHVLICVTVGKSILKVNLLVYEVDALQDVMRRGIACALQSSL
jgi:hypothetical protein